MKIYLLWFSVQSNNPLPPVLLGAYSSDESVIRADNNYYANNPKTPKDSTWITQMTLDVNHMEVV